VSAAPGARPPERSAAEAPAENLSVELPWSPRLLASAIAAIAALSALPAVVAGQPLSRAEIENARRYDAHGDPKFTAVAAESLSKSIRVEGARSYAVFGYNTPAVVVKLPAADNSAYALVEFQDAKPLGKDGKPLPHEIEHGIYDNDSHSTQIRFTPPSGGKGLVPLTRATGRVQVNYPVEIRTASVKPGSPEAAKLGISIDGPFVKYRPDALALPEAASFTGIDPLRAYDSSGKRLERYDGIQKSELANGVSTRTVAFWGPVASVRYDTVVRWAEREIPFDVMAAPLRPSGREGLGP